jgi:hypothetical protein
MTGGGRGRTVKRPDVATKGHRIWRATEWLTVVAGLGWLLIWSWFHERKRSHP